ncbi:MAG: virulence-associated E family protein [Fusobacterium necrophorum]|nr:virulence-associated E family protein [Fusobacterium necrophorum]
MQYSRTITISTANNRYSEQWTAVEMTWTAFVEKLGKPIVTAESYEEYMTYKKKKQDQIKDVGGFVGGALASSLRRNSTIRTRSIVTLDLDNLVYQDDEKILKILHSLNCSFVVYSTRKHSKVKPRLRVIFPLAADVSADEYEPIARKLASFIGMLYCDPTTFQPVRLMYWPSHSKDSDYVYEYADKGLIDGKAILNTYANWHDVRQWPEVPGAAKLHENMAKKQADPLEKEGIVGAFCRRYNILEAIEEFLPGVYEPCDTEGRLTFVGGSTTAGAVLYEDGLFLYSHHATDPCSQKLVNAFDLVRLHKFGHKDDTAEEGTPVGRLPSYLAMKEFILEKTPVKIDLIRERQEQAMKEFAVVLPDNSHQEEVLEGEVVEEEEAWEQYLECKSDGFPLPTIPNISLILRKDPKIREKIYYEEFSNRLLVRCPLPWGSSEKQVRVWADTDDSGLRWFFEKFYKISGANKIMDGVNLISEENKENAVALYLQSQTWDGIERLETLFIDYLGCVDNIYTREAAKLSMVAAVRRAIIGGIKWDYMPIFIGPQGTGKSTFLRILGKEWFNDSFANFEGKEACELIQGSWIVEVSELTGLRKSEINTTKQFLTRQEDIFREAYGRRTKKYPRRCVFFGTSNDAEFLKDASGNRRFWPIDTFVQTPKKSISQDLAKEVDQIWAEACELSKREDFHLVLSKEAEMLARLEQESHREDNFKRGIIEEYLDKKLPRAWGSMDLFARRAYLQDYENQVSLHPELFERDRVCIAEIWEEALGNDKRFMKKVDSFEIADIMAGMKGWEKMKYPMKMKNYGNQKGYLKKQKSGTTES